MWKYAVNLHVHHPKSFSEKILKRCEAYQQNEDGAEPNAGSSQMFSIGLISFLQ